MSSVDQRPNFKLVGAKTFEHLLYGGKELTVSLWVLLSDYRAYDLQTVRLSVLDGGGSEIPYDLSSQWILKMNPCSTPTSVSLQSEVKWSERSTMS